MLQTGPGTPDWQYLTYRLKWSGPVDSAQSVRLTILSPFWLSPWRMLGIVLLGLLVPLCSSCHMARHGIGVAPAVARQSLRRVCSPR